MGIMGIMGIMKYGFNFGINKPHVNIYMNSIRNPYGWLKWTTTPSRLSVVSLVVREDCRCRDVGSYFLYNYLYLNEFREKPIVLYAWERNDMAGKLAWFYGRNGFLLYNADIYTEPDYTIYMMYMCGKRRMILR
jgi:hypothetical protein